MSNASADSALTAWKEREEFSILLLEEARRLSAMLRMA